MKKLLLSALVVSLLGACASTAEPEKKPAVEDRTSQSQTTGTTKPADSKPIDQSGVNGSGLAPHLDPANKLSSDRSVYFDYDQYSVKDEYRATVENHAKYLSSNAKLKVKIEGNADERGSAEYNRRLGLKRAENVRASLVAQGAGDKQVRIKSLGEARPKVVGHDEASWSENRRADVVYEVEN